jgi:hypothetical protein
MNAGEESMKTQVLVTERTRSFAKIGKLCRIKMRKRKRLET